jgi:hypothetical protein
MSFQPVVPFGGLSGWSFLERTRARQEAAFQQSPTVVRQSSQFEARIASIKSPQDLVSDRALLQVALGAFGLDADIGNRFFIRKVLEEGTTARTALANRLSDKRYLAMAEAFGFGDKTGGNVARPDFGAQIVAQFKERQFEVAVGQADPNLRLALGIGREMKGIADRPMSNDARWFAMMASPPLRTVFERALRLPPETGRIDIDRQLAIFKERAARQLGTSDFASLATPDGEARLRQGFLTSAQTSGLPTSARGSSALALLTAAPRFFASPSAFGR